MQQSYPIGIRNGLISGRHRKQIGKALWEFLWLVDHITEEYETASGEIRGKVLGGALITADRIASEFSDEELLYTVSADTIGANLAILERAGYIVCRRGRKGLQIEVRHSKKWPQRFFDPDSSVPSKSHVSTSGDTETVRTGDSEIPRFRKTPESPDLQISKSPVASIDNADPEDITESNSTMHEGIANASRFHHAWQDAVAEAAALAPRQSAEYLRGCRLAAVSGNRIMVQLPCTDARKTLERFGKILGQALAQLLGHGVELVLIDPTNEARAGP